MGADGVKPYQSKIYYVIFLALATVISFTIGRVGELSAAKDIEVLDTTLFSFNVECEDVAGTVFCSGESAVLRASFASVLFFSIMLLGVLPVPTLSGDKSWRPLLGEGFHRGFWGIKIIIYFGLVIGSFFFAFFNDDAYTGVARFMSLIFLMVQVLVLVDFAYIWNETWVERSDVDNDYSSGSSCWLYALLTISGLLYLFSIGGLIAMLVLYKGCAATVAFATVGLVLIVIITLLTLLKDKIFDDEDLGGSIAPPAVVSFYIAYLVFSASTSNPDPAEECDPFDIALGQNAGEIFISILLTTVTLVWTALTVSGNATNLIGGGDPEDRPEVGGAYEIQDADGTVKYARDADGGQDPYADPEETSAEATGDKLWFFHAIMITASFYMAMLLTNWGVSEGEVEELGPQVGDISMFVKAAASWAAGLLYIWTVIAPHVLPDRDF